MRAPIRLGIPAILSFLLFTLELCSAQSSSATSITVYYVPGQTPLGTAAGTASAATPTSFDQSLQAYNASTLVAPAPPGASALPTSFALPIPTGVPVGASIKQNGSFFGFSIEMSVVNQVLGKNSTVLQVPFLNLMSNLQQRVGRINIRVGGNTQETATLVANTTDGRILEKDLAGVTNPTDTPPLIYTPDLIYMLGNISTLVNVRWYLGVPFNDTSNFRLQIIEQGQAILGDHLIAVQAGNEPDLYGSHGHRALNYSQQDYFNEFGLLINAINADPLITSRDILIGPSVSTNWSPESVFDTGYIDAYTNSLAYLSVEHYPSDNCGVAFPSSGLPVHDPQQLLSSYLSHSSATSLAGAYIDSTNIAQQKGKQFLMFETNTASCGGFVGLSDAFTAALWGLDYGMQMAATNFSGALFHVGGQSVSYNPFTPPPTNESVFHAWTVGPIYYSALVMAEALGPSNASQVIDLQANGNNSFSPAYGIWENGNLVRALLINFANDPSGASDLQVDLSMTGGQMPSQVDVKYLLANNVTQKGNYTWAGQTFGGNFQSDGRPIGTENITSVPCNTGTQGACTIHVPAPGAALVFLSGSGAAQDTAGAPSQTFSTSTVTKAHNTVTIDAASLATSNGGRHDQLGSTSAGSAKSAAQSRRNAGIGGVVALGLEIFVGWVVAGAR
ncbi:glycoside hydrolase family 79 protein [Pholiota conissans]|uniref:Glycoside hydrolase family 79 protein n=1 Tax=Pholiota conissans TaxID=109636 RepID=A0A9P5Z9S0_9AGAR|nr:glycoside hydrolase family 79 protein [Pholiota conissans]